ncbi:MULTISPECIES: phosphoenolpyruvate carboxylase [Olivibacter]|uniref:Phosphoenolpyruvate carboxylase n=1 Tax=Olivibacter oleidegradans TaxID=760123 RepID=A0ABV6HJE5_9SPHI|nr:MULTISPECIES: phosphoenolpyruvate carboxylase [Olivibacter]MDM8175023.1 phosphoenolpyruvate carboxylase [Olivibacter sp. 47]QEL01803.1 phosphoenolpyruvate carboxylase [Olivibacter sp. LS-1]
MKLSQKEAVYENEVLTRFELYNSLFLTLPFYQVKHTGTLLPFFSTHIEKGVNDKMDPEAIIESFFGQYEQYIHKADRFDLLFRIIQYIERQVVLFDAIEDAAFSKTGRADDAGSLESLFKRAENNNVLRDKIVNRLKDFSLRLVLTAHPTQFYPGEVLGIITDLTGALKKNDINDIHLLLQQLGKTPFLQKNKPTPIDEARSLAWFLEHVFYPVVSDIQCMVDNDFDANGCIREAEKQIVELGFWPGGDRDGNPNVTTESTKEVSALLRTILFRCYYRDFRVMKRRITFRGVEKYMAALQEIFYENSFNPQENQKNVKDAIIFNLSEVKRVLTDYHDRLFVNLVDDLLRKVKIFGTYFSSLDIRQDSSILRKTYQYLYKAHPEETGIDADFETLEEADKIMSARFREADLPTDNIKDPLILDMVETIRFVQKIQQSGGPKACHRFIISNCQQASDILSLMELFLWNGWKKETLSIDFVPLFETVDDLKRAAKVMEILYNNKAYQSHLKHRGNKQTIMLGFSDSTKDGGYLMANWSIYKAKMELTAMARKYDVDLTFFDGRGGPPARGGGKTQRFYASMGDEIANDHIQLTIQGQTISSQYGSFDTAHYNIEQLLNAGITSGIKTKPGDTLSQGKKMLIDRMAGASYNKFMELRKHPLFLKYLEELSPLKFLSSLNISSRPVKRNSNSELRLEDLRAISFVTAWSQLKQSVPGCYGVGTALKNADDSGEWDKVQELYNTSGMFKTIIDNSIMSMTKSNFNITAYLKDDEKFGTFWNMLREEFELTKQYFLKLTGTTMLMERYPVERKSIATREKIVLPLVIIQHYAIKKMHNLSTDDPNYEIYGKLLTRTVYGIVNAGRNLV